MVHTLTWNNLMFHADAADPASASHQLSKISNGNLDRVEKYLRSAVYFPDYTMRGYH